MKVSVRTRRFQPIWTNDEGQLDVGKKVVKVQSFSGRAKFEWKKSNVKFKGAPLMGYFVVQQANGTKQWLSTYTKNSYYFVTLPLVALLILFLNIRGNHSLTSALSLLGLGILMLCVTVYQYSGYYRLKKELKAGGFLS